MPCPTSQDSSDGTPFRNPPRSLLARDTVRFVGDPIAFIVAETSTRAQEAAEQVYAEIEDLPVEVDPAAATVTAFTYESGDAAAVAEAFARAHRTVALDAINNRVVVCPMENRSAIGLYDSREERYELITQTQGVFFMRAMMAATLGVDESRIRVVTPDVGGSFGARIQNYPEQTLVLAAARLLGRPVTWVSSRAEGFLADIHGRDQTSRAELALDSDGRILALKVETIGNLGAYASPIGPSVAAKGVAKSLGHCYDLPVLHFHARCVYTNTAPTDAYRGAGKPEAQALVERLVDKAASVCGVDPLTFRRRNLIPMDAMPTTAANGFRYDSARFELVMDRAAAAADWAGFEGRRAEARARGRLRGIGMGLYLHLTGGSTTETSEVSLMPDGSILVKTGVQASGQGHETGFVQLVADRLGIDPTRVTLLEGDSDRLSRGGGTGGSGSLPIAATTIARATDRFVDNARALAADRLEAAAVDVEYGAGRFTVVGTDRTIGLFDLVGDGPINDGTGDDLPACAGSADFEGEAQTLPHGAYVAEVEIDPETGQMRLERFVTADDLGVRLNPAIAAGQIHGGVAQGIGQAMLEHTVYDPGSGQLLTGSFMDYGLPRADDLPWFELHECDLPTAENPLGMKGVGELGPIGAPAAILNAVADAIGTHDFEMPVTPETLWRLTERFRKT